MRAAPPSAELTVASKFMNENGWTKVGRKLREEPLIPLGKLFSQQLPQATASRKKS